MNDVVMDPVADVSRCLSSYFGDSGMFCSRVAYFVLTNTLHDILLILYFRYKYTDEEQRLARKSKSELWHIVQEE